MGWFLVAWVLLALLIVLGAAKVSGRESAIERTEAERVMQIREERLAPEVTPVPAPEEPKPVTWARYDVPLEDDLQRYIGEVCRRYEVPTAVVMAIIDYESDCDPTLIGDSGNSYGLMQIYASQHTERCIRLNCYNLLDPRQNVLAGIDYLAELMATGHDMDWVLSWYNGHGGEPCGYAVAVLTEAERLLESVQTATESGTGSDPTMTTSRTSGIGRFRILMEGNELQWE